MPEDVVQGAASGVSRRAALRAGVAVGVGVAAWSGVGITSLGGTPAYAGVCTGAIPPIDLTEDGGCRNIDVASGCAGPYRYHDAAKSGDIPVSGYPSGSFSVSPALGEGICCSDNKQQTFTFPAELKCQVFIQVFTSNPLCSAGTSPTWTLAFPAGGPASSPVVITYSCITGPGPSDKYRLFARCSTSGTGDPSCFPPPPG
jgi:hypothetical protein